MSSENLENGKATDNEEINDKNSDNHEDQSKNSTKKIVLTNKQATLIRIGSFLSIIFLGLFLYAAHVSSNIRPEDSDKSWIGLFISTASDFSNRVDLFLKPYAGSFLLVIYGIFVCPLLFIMIFPRIIEQIDSSNDISGSVNKTIIAVAEKPENVDLQIDLSRKIFNRYYERNLRSSGWLLMITACVIVAGICLIGYGIIIVYNDPEKLSYSAIPVLGGAVTTFIGSTLLVVNKSLMDQGKEYAESLQRVNNIGIALSILESISSDEKDHRADISKKIVMALIKENDIGKDN